MEKGLGETLALAVLAVTLAAAVARPRWLPESAAGAGGAALLVVAGAVSTGHALSALGDLAPTVGFLAALLVLADGCRREGLFDAAGAAMALRSRGRPRRLLALVFLVAASITAALSLDATVLLLTPVVFATAVRLRTSPKPHVYACSHLANSASLLLPVSNLTNLLAFRASGISFTRFAAVMALPWAIAIALEWVVLSRSFSTELTRPAGVEPGAAAAEVPRFALTVLALTLLGFVLSSSVGVDPVWAAIAGAVAINAPALWRRSASAGGVLRATEPTFLIFVLGLGVIVRAASDDGLHSVIASLLPGGGSLWALVGIAAVSAALANLVNNLPATLILVPVAATGGPVSVLATLIGVNAGPNLTYAGSLATLLWRRVLHAREHETDVVEFLRLGLLTVPAILVLASAGLWLAAKVLL